MSNAKQVAPLRQYHLANDSGQPETFVGGWLFMKALERLVACGLQSEADLKDFGPTLTDLLSSGQTGASGLSD
jgi:hypothetical protein